MLTPEQIARIRSNAGAPPVEKAGARSLNERLGIAPKVEGEEEVAPDSRGMFEKILKRPLERLVLEPARRAGEAIGTAGVSLFGNDEMLERGQKESGKDKVIDVPLLGEFRMKGVKQAGEGGVKQLAGETLESASYLAPYLGGSSIVTKPAVGVVKGALTGAGKGAASGAVYGAAQGVATGLQEDLTAGEIAMKGVTGGVVGGVAGGVIGGVTGGVTGGLNKRAIRHKEIEEGLRGTAIPGEKLAYAKESIIHSEASDVDKMIAMGEAPRSAVYKYDSGKVLAPSFAEARINDVATKLDRLDDGLGEKFRQLVNKNEITQDEIVAKGLDVLEDYSKMGSGAAGFTMKGGKIVVDQAAKDALKSGLDPTDIQFIKNADDVDKGAFKKMMAVAERGAKDKTIVERAGEEAGKTVLKPVQYLEQVQDDVGAKIGESVKKIAGQPLDVNSVIDDFAKNLDDAGIKINQDGLDFSTSRYANAGGVQKQLQNLWSSLRKTVSESAMADKTSGTMPAEDVFRLRQRIFTDLKLGQRAGELDDQAMVIMEKVRKNLEKPLTEASGDYKALATQYAKAFGALKEFKKLLGKDFDIDSPVANLRASEVANRVLGNASARPLGVIKLIEDTSKELGYKPSGNARNQILFADLLEDVFGTSQSRSLRGQLARGVGDAERATGAAADAAQGNLVGLGVKAINYIRQRTPDAQIRALKTLIGS